MYEKREKMNISAKIIVSIICIQKSVSNVIIQKSMGINGLFLLHLSPPSLPVWFIPFCKRRSGSCFWRHWRIARVYKASVIDSKKILKLFRLFKFYNYNLFKLTWKLFRYKKLLCNGFLMICNLRHCFESC